MLQNPWLHLPTSSPLVLESDSALLESFNASASEQHKYDLSLFPEPFFGSLDASVIVLTLNPGWSPEDAVVHAQPEFAQQARHSLAHTLAPYPFLHLQPTPATPGARWWSQRTRELVNDLGLDVVAKQLACVQYMPYHSIKYSRRTPMLPSQKYGFMLIRLAMAREAEIVIMRSRKLWFAAVPELMTYKRLHIGSNPRAAYLSRGNLKSAYDIVTARLRDT